MPKSGKSQGHKPLKNLIKSTFIAIALGLLFSVPYSAPIDAAATVDDRLDITTFAKLPACTTKNTNSSVSISDYGGPLSWGATAIGGGTGVAKVYCNGTTWQVIAGGAGGNAPPPPPPPSPGGAMPAPSIASNTSALGNYANSCNGNGTSCLLFEDQFSGVTTPPNQGGATTLSNLWVPYQANGICGGCNLWHRWTVREMSNANHGTTTNTPSPFTGDRTCNLSSASWSQTNPPWNTCTNNDGGEDIDSYGSAFPYGTSVNVGDGNHLLGGTSNGNQLSLITTPGNPNSVLPADAEGNVAVNEFAGGHVWTGSIISSNFPNTLNGRHAMTCPASGCYIQIRGQLEDCTKGGDFAFAMYMADGSGTGSQEFDIHECGFNWFGGNPVPPNTNYTVSAVLQTDGLFAGYSVCNSSLGAFNSGDSGHPARNPGCQVNMGVDLTQAYHVYGMEYNPNNWFKVYIDGILIGTFFSNNGYVGSKAYVIAFEGDLASFRGTHGQPPFGSIQDWPSTTTNCCTSPPNERYTTNVNDIQIYKLPGQ